MLGLSRSRGLAVAAIVAAVAVAGLVRTGVRAQSACAFTPAPVGGLGGGVLYATTVVDGQPWVAGAVYHGGDGTPIVAAQGASEWDEIRLPKPWGVSLSTMQDLDRRAGAVWAVGSSHSPIPIAGRWDGKAWRWTEPVVAGAEDNILLGVAIAGANDVWAVGRTQEGSENLPLVQRWDGQRWSLVPVPAVEISSTLKDVVALAPDDVWAVGWSVADGGTFHPLVMHWDGSVWNTAPVPGEGLLSGVTRTDDGGLLAVGWDPASSTTVAAIRDGDGWSRIDPGVDGQLFGVAMGDQGAVAVGHQLVDDGRRRPLALRWDAGSWNPITLPSVGELGDAITAVTGGSDTWIVGTRWDAEGYGPLVLHETC